MGPTLLGGNGAAAKQYATAQLPSPKNPYEPSLPAKVLYHRPYNALEGLGNVATGAWMTNAGELGGLAATASHGLRNTPYVGSALAHAAHAALPSSAYNALRTAYRTVGPASQNALDTGSAMVRSGLMDAANQLNPLATVDYNQPIPSSRVFDRYAGQDGVSPTAAHAAETAKSMSSFAAQLPVFEYGLPAVTSQLLHGAKAVPGLSRAVRTTTSVPGVSAAAKWAPLAYMAREPFSMNALKHQREGAASSQTDQLRDYADYLNREYRLKGTGNPLLSPEDLAKFRADTHRAIGLTGTAIGGLNKSLFPDAINTPPDNRQIASAQSLAKQLEAMQPGITTSKELQSTLASIRKANPTIDPATMAYTALQATRNRLVAVAKDNLPEYDKVLSTRLGSAFTQKYIAKATAAFAKAVGDPEVAGILARIEAAKLLDRQEQTPQRQ